MGSHARLGMAVEGSVTWISWATHRDGPSDKMYPETNKREGLVLHSVEGSLAGAFSVLANPDREASWHFTCGIDGKLYQHYPLTASCWASGNKTANTSYFALESEGTAAFPINAAQVATIKRLIVELRTTLGIKLTRESTTLREHREVATLWTPNAGATACPSNRYAPLYTALATAPAPDRLAILEEQVKSLIDQVAQLQTQTWGQPGKTSAYVDQNVLVTVRNVHDRLKAIERQAPPGGVAYHEHGGPVAP